MMHKTIGILGGMSPESSIEYYRYITREYTRRTGTYAYPPILLYSVSFQTYTDWCKEERWDLITQDLITEAKKLETAGADFILLATNTMHLVAGELQAALQIPLLSLLDAVAEAALARNLSRLGILGTKFTMQKNFYAQALAKKGLTVLPPEPSDHDEIQRIIYEELTAGKILPASRQFFLEVIQRLQARGCDGVILGCTEIPLLVQEEDIDFPLLNTTLIHAEAALNFAVNLQPSP